MLDVNEIILDDMNNVYKRNIDWNKFQNATVLITGINGLIASYITYMLLYLNDVRNSGIKVVGIARNPEKVQKKFGTLLERSDIEIVYQDVAKPIMYKDGVDYIIHTASPTGPKQFMSTPVDTILANVMGTHNLLEFSRKKGIKGFLMLSTREIYGTGEKEFVKEEDYGAMDPTLVRSCYPESKRLAETLCASYREQYGVNCQVVRIAHTYGPQMLLSDGRVVGDFLGNVVNGNDIIMNSDGSGTLALTYIADVLAGIMITLCNFEGFVYNISNSEETITVRQLAEILCDLFAYKNIHPKFKEVDEKERAGYLKNKLGFLDSEKALQEGWNVEFSLKSGMERTVKYFESLKG